jgi:hypothetical protein
MMQRKTLFCSGILVLTLAQLAAVAAPATQPSTLTISKQTTWITSPLYPDGTPDYIGAMNQMASGGVTAQNNAAIMLLRLGIMDQADAKNAFKVLGLSASQATLLPMENTTDFFEEHLPQELAEQKVNESLLPGWNQNHPNSPAELFASAETQFAGHYPWTADKCVMLYAYLLKMGPTLDELQQASELSQFYMPMTNKEGFLTVIKATLAAQMDPEKIYDPLIWRATLDLGQGDITGCEQNLLAIHRYARLMAAQPVTVLTYMAAVQAESIAAGGDRVLLFDSSLTGKQALDYLKTLQSLGSLAPAWQSTNISVRFVILDVLSSYYRNAFHLGPYEKTPDELDGILSDVPKDLSGVDWNRVFERTNQTFEILSDYLRFPSDSDQGREAQSAYEKIEDQAEKFNTATAASVNDRLFWSILNDLNILGQGNFVDGIHYLGLYGSQVGQLTQIGLALAAYHAEHSAYPDKLDALSPEYFPQLPVNLFTGKPLSYVRTADGYKLAAPFKVPDDTSSIMQGANQDLLTLQVPAPPPEAWESDPMP